MKMDLEYGPSISVNAEWEMREILTHIDLMPNTQLGRSAVGKEITEFHCAKGY